MCLIHVYRIFQCFVYVETMNVYLCRWVLTFFFKDFCIHHFYLNRFIYNFLHFSLVERVSNNVIDQSFDKIYTRFREKKNLCSIYMWITTQSHTYYHRIFFLMPVMSQKKTHKEITNEKFNTLSTKLALKCTYAALLDTFSKLSHYFQRHK